jgi:acetyl esterase/lipase
MSRLATVALLGVVVLAARRQLTTTNAKLAIPVELRSPLMALTFPSEARMLPVVRQVLQVSMPSGPRVNVTNKHVNGTPRVRVRVTAPATGGARRPCVLWIHGGGTVVGSPQFESLVTGPLARELDCVVVAPAYRLAPENPFPAALDDCMAALRWTREHAGELGIDADRIAVAGPSAGGGLAAAVAQRSHDEGISLRTQVIVYGMLDDRTALIEEHAGRGRFVLTPSGYRFAWTAYLGREPRMTEAPNYAAAARRADLTGLPPAWIGVGDADLLYPENVAYAERLRECGVPCELVTVKGMYHGADGIASKAPTMQAFRHSMLDYLRAHL